MPMIFTMIANYAAWLRVSGASIDTISHRAGVIRRLPFDPLTATSLDLIGWLATFDNPATRSSYRAALRTFYRWATEFDLIDTDPSTRIPRVKVPPTSPRPISDTSLTALLATLTGEHRAVALLMAYCGLRGSEAARVTPADFYTVGGHWRLTVTHPKGGGVQSVPIPAWVMDAVSPWLPVGLSHRAIISTIARRLQQIEPGATPHSLRHWYATTTLRDCGNVRIVQELLRHKSLASTQIYTQVSEVEAASVADRLPHVA